MEHGRRRGRSSRGDLPIARATVAAVAALLALVGCATSVDIPDRPAGPGSSAPASPDAAPSADAEAPAPSAPATSAPADPTALPPETDPMLTEAIVRCLARTGDTAAPIAASADEEVGPEFRARVAAYETRVAGCRFEAVRDSGVTDPPVPSDAATP